jgi:methylated-DNA-[protein]-cysteine S-methyltransferase
MTRPENDRVPETRQEARTAAEARLRHALGSELAPWASSERTDSLLAAVAKRAVERELLDVGYTTADSPVGRLLLAATPVGVLRVGFASEAQERILDELATCVSTRLLRAPLLLEDARRQLSDYFEGARRCFELPLDWRLTSGFRRSVLAATARLAFGETRTYRELATAAGNPRAVRAAGSALATNPLPIIVPCHRVVRSDGTLGDYRGGRELKRMLLEHERAQLLQA